MGFDECILSSEVDYESAKALLEDYQNRHNSKPNVGFVIYGKIDMMIMRSCPIGVHYKNKQIHCQRCHQNKYELVDRIGEKYRVIGDSSECNTRILSNHPIFLLDRMYEIRKMGAENLWIILTDEHEEKVDELITHLENNDGEFNRFNLTRGHYNKRPL